MTKRKSPPISAYMTPTPHSIGPDQPLSLAHEVMREHHVRHLPVLDGGKLVGMVSVRDLHLVETFEDVDPEDVQVEEAMTPEPYTVAPDTPLDQVAAEMAEHKYGSAVVLDGHKVVGVFTTVDACRALTDALRGHLAH